MDLFTPGSLRFWSGSRGLSFTVSTPASRRRVRSPKYGTRTRLRSREEAHPEEGEGTDRYGIFMSKFGVLF